MRTRTCTVVAVATTLALAPLSGAAGARQTIAFTAVARSQKETTSTRTVLADDYLGSTQIGTEVLTCKAATGTCAAVISLFTLPKGTVTVQSSSQSGTGAGKVTGGTGSFAGVRGTFNYIDLNTAGTITGVTIQLS